MKIKSLTLLALCIAPSLAFANSEDDIDHKDIQSITLKIEHPSGRSNNLTIPVELNIPNNISFSSERVYKAGEEVVETDSKVITTPYYKKVYDEKLDAEVTLYDNDYVNLALDFSWVEQTPEFQNGIQIPESNGFSVRQTFVAGDEGVLTQVGSSVPSLDTTTGKEVFKSSGYTISYKVSRAD